MATPQRAAVVAVGRKADGVAIVAKVVAPGSELHADEARSHTLPQLSGVGHQLGTALQQSADSVGLGMGHTTTATINQQSGASLWFEGAVDGRVDDYATPTRYVIASNAARSLTNPSPPNAPWI